MAFPVDHFQEIRQMSISLVFCFTSALHFRTWTRAGFGRSDEAVAWNVKKLWEGAMKRLKIIGIYKQATPRKKGLYPRSLI